MNASALAPALALVLAGALLWSVAVRTADGRIGPNRWLGIRTKATRASAATWQQAHQAARPSTVRAARAFVLSGLVVPVQRAGGPLAGIGVLLALVWLYRGTRAGVRAVTDITPRDNG